MVDEDERESVMIGLPTARMTFARPKRHEGGSVSVEVTLDLDGMCASYRASSYGLVDFFRALADDWRGWDGARVFTFDRYDHQYTDFPGGRLSCWHDGIGRVAIEATLGDLPSHEGLRPGWAATGVIMVEPGTLAGTAEDLVRLLT